MLHSSIVYQLNDKHFVAHCTKQSQHGYVVVLIVQDRVQIVFIISKAEREQCKFPLTAHTFLVTFTHATSRSTVFFTPRSRSFNFRTRSAPFSAPAPLTCWTKSAGQESPSDYDNRVFLNEMKEHDSNMRSTGSVWSGINHRM